MSTPDDIRFDSWKEIASYLGRDLRTVRRWEKERGLPVHRVPGDGRRAIFAFRSEIDAWLSLDKGSAGIEQAGAVGTAIPVYPDVGNAAPAAETERATNQNTRILAMVMAAVCALTIVVVFRTKGAKGAGAATVGFTTHQILGYNGGKVIWSYDFEQPLRDVRPEEVPFKMQIGDSGANGSKEIQVAVPQLVFERGDLSTDALYSFSPRGEVLWKHPFADNVRFGGEDCGPRWEICHLMSTGTGRQRKLWCAICSFPTSVAVLIKMDADGQMARHFVNYGHLRTLNELKTSGGNYLLAGGTNNESNEGALAVLREEESAGKSPQSGGLANCDGCPEGQPFRYYLFPRSEVNRSIGPAYNSVFEIIVTGTRIQVMTSEAGWGSPPADWAMYEISAEDFLPKAVSFSDHYRAIHERLSAEGRIKHGLEKCPERIKPIIVRAWSGEQGWTKVELPPLAAAER